MDLFEYQAKQLFAEVRRPGQPRRGRRRRPTRPTAIAERIGGVTVVKAQVKVGGRGKAGGVKVAKTPDEAGQHAEAILGMDIKGHTVHRVLVDPGRGHQGGVLRLLPARPGQPHVPRDGVLRGRHGDRAAGRRAPGRAGQGAGRCASSGVDLDKAREIAVAAKFPAEIVDQVADVLVKLWQTLRRRGRDAGRGEPAGPASATGRSSRSTARSRWTRTPTSASPATPASSTSPRPTRSSRRPRRSTSTTSSSTARSASSATAPGW